jgi:cytochrome c biogenesis protein
VAILGMSDGVVLQDLPFDIELKKFIVEYYDTGMPKLFASEVVLHDHDTGAQRPVTIKVNEPAKHRGITIYQSSFEDGGSTLQLRALPLSPAGKTTDLQGKVGESRALAIGSGSDNLTLELTGLRVINVENMGAPEAVDESTDTRSVKLANALGQHTGSGAKGDRAKVLHNIGPSFSYKLRDASGQAREFNNYMLPVDLDGQRVFLAGVRDTPSEPLRYLRIPADDKDSLATWLQTKAALADPALRTQAIKRYVTQATPADKPEMAEQLRLTADRVLSLFSGAERPPGPAGAETGGLRALAQFIEAKVPEAERPRASDVLLRVLSSCLFELTQIARAQAGSPPLPTNDTTRLFMQATTLSLSDAAHYPAPALLQLTNFTQVQASVFQLTRAPGKTLVYLGAVLLMIGVLAMLYIRERRLRIWLQPADGGRTRIQLALSTTRRTLDADAEFDALKHDLLSSPR